MAPYKYSPYKSVARRLFNSPTPYGLSVGQIASVAGYQSRRSMVAAAGRRGRNMRLKRTMRAIEKGMTPARAAVVAPGLKSFGAYSSKSRGFFKRGSRRYNKNKWNKMARSDVVKTFEYGTIQSEKYTTYVGHATCNGTQLLDVFCQSLVKLLAKRMGFDVSDMEQLAPVNAGDIFRIESMNLAGVPTGTNYVVTTIPTWKFVASKLYDIFYAASTDQTIFTQLFFIPITPPAGAANTFARIYMNLKSMFVEFDVKGTMKIQNRSKNSTVVNADDNAEDIDNVPIYGKVYEGYGNGSVSATPSTTALYADAARGVITKIPGTEFSYREPPTANIFPQVTKSGKAHLDPAEIKTSVLTFRKKMPLQQFLVSVGDTIFTHKLGNFRFFAFEKMIETVNNEASIIPLTIAFEVNTKVGVKISMKSLNNTISQFTVVQ